MRHDPGLDASPPVPYIIGSGEEWVLFFPLTVRCGRTTSSRSCGGTSAQEDLLWAYGCSRGARSSPSRSSSPRRTSAGRSSPNACATPSTLATTPLKEADQTLPAELVPGNVSNPGDSVDCSPTTGIDGPKRRSWPEKFRLGRGSDGARLAYLTLDTPPVGGSRGSGGTALSRRPHPTHVR